MLAGGNKETQNIVRQSEAAGFDGARSGEILRRSALIAVAAMAGVTTLIGVGCAIAYALGQVLLALATDARFIYELIDGRFTLSIGTGTHRMME
jgi:alkanesulfonate monooxygenase SsuD/methylene tetrahydromethanopterin reductase-like flavin-dependent oxidoreductase (luciferase family)